MKSNNYPDWLKIRPEDISDVQVGTVLYPCGNIDGYYVAKYVEGEFKRKGEPWHFELNVFLSEYEGHVVASIEVAMCEMDDDGWNTENETEGFADDAPECWPIIECFLPSEEWPREVFVGHGLSARSDTSDPELREVIDAYAAERGLT